MAEKEPTIGYMIPERQRITYTITPEPGYRISLQSVGGQLTALGKLMEELAREDDGLRIRAVVDEISMASDGSIRFVVALLPQLRPSKEPDNE